MSHNRDVRENDHAAQCVQTQHESSSHRCERGEDHQRVHPPPQAVHVQMLSNGLAWGAFHSGLSHLPSAQQVLLLPSCGYQAPFFRSLYLGGVVRHEEDAEGGASSDVEAVYRRAFQRNSSRCVHHEGVHELCEGSHRSSGAVEISGSARFVQQERVHPYQGRVELAR